MIQRPWNLCLTHDPSLAGLYRAINDFSLGLQAPILSFDDGRVDRTALSKTDGAHRIRCGGSFVFRDCHRLSSRATGQAERLLRDANLLVVHSLFRAHVAWGRRWAHGHEKPYWIIPHGCLDPWGLRRRAAVKRLWLMLSGSRCLADADGVVFSSRRELSKARCWLAKDNGVVVHWPVDIPDLTDQSDRRFNFRTTYGIPPDARLLLYVGRLHTMKRPIETVQAFAAGAGAGAHLLVIGMDGDLSRQHIQARVPPSIRTRVHVVGEMSGLDLHNAMLAADAFISLSHRENFGYAMCDALAHGLPIIVTPGHDLLDELPVNAETRLACGWRLDDEKLVSAATAIADFCDCSQGQITDMGASGREWATTQLSHQRFRNTLTALVPGG
jgi:glycosyltransferase involved in cell wall biosynthesis